MSKTRLRATVRGSGSNGVIHVGFRRWILQQAVALNCTCTAINVGDTVELFASGEYANVHILLARARIGPPNSRVLGVTIEKEEHINGLD
jgi:acylphosphatase